MPVIDGARVFAFMIHLRFFMRLGVDPRLRLGFHDGGDSRLNSAQSGPIPSPPQPVKLPCHDAGMPAHVVPAGSVSPFITRESASNRAPSSIVES